MPRNFSFLCCQQAAGVHGVSPPGCDLEGCADRTASRLHLSSPALCTPDIFQYLQRAQRPFVTADLPLGSSLPGKAAGSRGEPCGEDGAPQPSGGRVLAAVFSDRRWEPEQAPQEASGQENHSQGEADLRPHLASGCDSCYLKEFQNHYYLDASCQECSSIKPGFLPSLEPLTVCSSLCSPV